MRLIDADVLLNILERERKEHDEYGLSQRADGITDAIMDIIDAPTIEPQRWIPVTPDSPPLYMPVLTWDGETRHVEQRIPYVRDEIGEKIFSDWWIDGDEKWDEWAEYQPNIRDGCAIKWMPLPEPYKGGEHENR